MSDDRRLPAGDGPAAQRPVVEVVDAAGAGKDADSQAKRELSVPPVVASGAEDSGESKAAGESSSSTEEVANNEAGGQEGARRATERDVKALRALINRVAAQIGSENEEVVGEAKRLLAGVVESLELVTGHVDDGVQRIEITAKQLEDGLQVHIADFDRWREVNSRSWKWLAIAGAFLAVPVLFVFGVLVEQQFQIVGVEDLTGGWRDHIWEKYGRVLVECATEAMRRDVEVSCTVSVHKP